MYLSYIGRAHGCCDSRSETNHGKICEKHALLKSKCDVKLKGTSWKLIAWLWEIHSKAPCSIITATNQSQSARKFPGLKISVEPLQMSDDIIGSFVLRGTKYSSLFVYVPYAPTILLYNKNTCIFRGKSEFKTEAKTLNMFPVRPTGYFERVGVHFHWKEKSTHSFIST